MSFQPALTAADLPAACRALVPSFNLHVRLVGYRDPEFAPDSVSTPWFCLENSDGGKWSDTRRENYMSQIGKELQIALSDDDKFADMHTILLCMSILDESGNPASSKLVSFPDGSSKVISQGQVFQATSKLSRGTLS